MATRRDAKREKLPEAVTSHVLIPGLPNEIALCILWRVPHVCQARLRVVCRSWKDAMEPATMHSMRMKLRIPEVWFVGWNYRRRGQRSTIFRMFDVFRGRMYRIYAPHQLRQYGSFLNFKYVSTVGYQVFIAVETESGAPIEIQGLYSFDAVRMKWDDGKYSRPAICAAVCAVNNMEGGNVYAAELGYNHNGNNIMKLDLKTRMWEKLPDLHMKRRGSFYGVMLRQNRLCILEEQDMQCTSGEIWDPIIREWTVVPDLCPSDHALLRRRSRVAVVMDQLYVLQYTFGRYFFSSELMYYEASSKVWISLGSLPDSVYGKVYRRGHRPFYPTERFVSKTTLFGMEEELWVIPHHPRAIWVTRPSDSQPLSWRSIPWRFFPFHKEWECVQGAMLV